MGLPAIPIVVGLAVAPAAAVAATIRAATEGCSGIARVVPDSDGAMTEYMQLHQERVLASRFLKICGLERLQDYVLYKAARVAVAVAAAKTSPTPLSGRNRVCVRMHLAKCLN
jgi:hypothetical protein